MVKAKANPFEKMDKAADKKAGVKENSKKDMKLDIKMMKKPSQAAMRTGSVRAGMEAANKKKKK